MFVALVWCVENDTPTIKPTPDEEQPMPSVAST